MIIIHISFKVWITCALVILCLHILQWCDSTHRGMARLSWPFWLVTVFLFVTKWKGVPVYNLNLKPCMRICNQLIPVTHADETCTRNFYSGTFDMLFCHSAHVFLVHYLGHPCKLYKQHSSCTARSSFFTERVVDIWNSLPADTDFFFTFRFYSIGKPRGFSWVWVYYW